ncbi:MAG TPA: hypothetical protein VKV20_01740 [Ktedonobacteraceae bacterium]|jgi:hypothetical protein|nr:hypothetical protein [Ktedonobacteraceae bacterium]
MRNRTRSKLVLLLTALILLTVIALPPAISTVTAQAAAPGATYSFPAQGDLDCNGFSKIQKLIKDTLLCTDPIGYDGERFYDNGHYIGHDEPTVNFFSNSPGSGNNVQWQITLPTEHALPATQTFEDTIALWVGMVICDPRSFPQKPCIPDSDQNHPARYAGDPNTSGSAFLELQLYPPGFYPFIHKISCDSTHWCAALNIDSLECNPDMSFCNPNCTEPVNFSFIQMNGVPPGPPGPADANSSTFTPNKETLLMNQGDKLKITVKDTSDGMLNKIEDLTTGKSGYMVASAKNGFEDLDLNTCKPTKFSFHPEYSTTKFGNFLNWGLGQGNVGYDTEIGHFTPGPGGDGDKDDPPCFKGPTLPGCLNFRLGGDVDFDGSSYLPDWPDGTGHTPTPVVMSSVLGNGIGPVSSPDGQSDYTHAYTSLQFDTEVLATEKTCTRDHLARCTVPPPGAEFYPFFAQSGHGDSCTFTFGNDIRGSTVNDFGRDLQYGAPNIQWSYLDSSSGIMPNPCVPHAE